MQQVHIQIKRKMSKDDANKQNPSHAKRRALQLNASKHKSKRYDDSQYHDRMSHTASPQTGKTFKQVLKYFHKALALF